MHIAQILIERFGPLANIDFRPGRAEVIYDDNGAGKTALVDAFIRLAFASPLHLFPDSDRIEDNFEGKVVIKDGDVDHTFPRTTTPRSIQDLLGWSEPRIARLLCIQASELELATRDQAFDRLIDALANALSGVGASLERVEDRVRYLAHLTNGGDWSNAQQHEQLRTKIMNDLQKWRNLESLKSSAFDIEEKQKELEKLQDERKDLERQVKEKDGKIEEIERKIQIKRY